jgi:hypothetical protein
MFGRAEQPVDPLHRVGGSRGESRLRDGARGKNDQAVASDRGSLAAAANVMARDPAALQLRLLQTVVEVASERNSTLVMPVPVELLRFFEKMTPAAPATGPSASLADFGDAGAADAGADVEAHPAAAGPGAIPPVEPTATPPLEMISIPAAQAPEIKIPHIAADTEQAVRP